MAAPGVTARVTPPNQDLKRGYQSLVAFSGDPNLNLYEKSVTPPAVDGGDEIDVTTMHNTTWETRAPRALKILDVYTFTASYDPCAYDECIALINNEQGITVHFPDLSTLSHWGFMKRFEPGALERGAHPESTVTIVPTNWDPTNKVEAGPSLVCVTGT